MGTRQFSCAAPDSCRLIIARCTIPSPVVLLVPISNGIYFAGCGQVRGCSAQEVIERMEGFGFFKNARRAAAGQKPRDTCKKYWIGLVCVRGLYLWKPTR